MHLLPRPHLFHALYLTFFSPHQCSSTTQKLTLSSWYQRMKAGGLGLYLTLHVSTKRLPVLMYTSGSPATTVSGSVNTKDTQHGLVSGQGHFQGFPGTKKEHNLVTAQGKQGQKKS
ncbi:hypothetical protein Pmani_008689 [Petrolisthes manimaculis]|uniref:Uncharacterized protein n=1 Tax=Petrolisthes manimaculis TaxID=1843537 RepID=A0AAE1UDM6_9EUCA|nr:hypothetical protein Pmani_008689 [Petrolisthes manimaculis]